MMQNLTKSRVITSGASETLSDKWRTQKSELPHIDLAHSLKAIQKVIGYVLTDEINVNFASKANSLTYNSGRSIVIDPQYALLGSPIEAKHEDVLLGLALHEAGHSIVGSLGLEHQAITLPTGEIVEVNVLGEEIYTDTYMGRHYLNAKDYITRARDAYNVDMCDYDNVRSIFIHVALYGNLPDAHAMGNSRVLKAIPPVMTMSKKMASRDWTLSDRNIIYAQTLQELRDAFYPDQPQAQSQPRRSSAPKFPSGSRGAGRPSPQQQPHETQSQHEDKTLGLEIPGQKEIDREPPERPKPQGEQEAKDPAQGSQGEEKREENEEAGGNGQGQREDLHGQHGQQGEDEQGGDLSGTPQGGAGGSDVGGRGETDHQRGELGGVDANPGTDGGEGRQNNATHPGDVGNTEVGTALTNDFHSRKYVLSGELLENIAQAIENEEEELTGRVRADLEFRGELDQKTIVFKRDKSKDMKACNEGLARQLVWLKELKNSRGSQYYRNEDFGKVDQRALYRAPINGKIFKRRVVLPQREQDIVLLLDASSSMARHRSVYENAHAVFRTLSDAVVLSYYDDDFDGVMVRRHDAGRKMTQVDTHGTTPSGSALLAAAVKFPKALIIHFTDGAPNRGTIVKDALETINKKAPDARVVNIIYNTAAHNYPENEHSQTIVLEDVKDFPAKLKQALTTWGYGG